jgi:hypothetical protein
MVLGTVVGLLIGLAVGAIGLFVAGQLVHGEQGDVEHATWTAIIGSVVWTVLAWIPIVGPFLLAPLAWLGVIRWRYPGSWAHAITVAVVAWLVAMAALLVLNALGLPAFDAVGIPFV